MAREITDYEQGTDKWKQAKLGKFSGSTFHVFLGESKTKDEKLMKIAGERFFQDYEEEDYASYAMQRGTLLEPEARRLYSAVYDVDVRQVGLLEAEGKYDGWLVCSPDGLVGDDGMIEIKSPLAHTFIDWVSKKGGELYIKPEYMTQIQLNLYVSEREWCDFVVYHPRVGIKVRRVMTDPEYFKKIENALDYGIDFINKKMEVLNDL